MITEESVREVIETARIEDVVGDFVSLKRRGQNLIGLCPFHNEKTPSFNVNPARNIYKCFGCGEGGDPVKFLMSLEQLSFPDAIKWIAQRYNIKIREKELSPEMQQERLEKDSLLLVNDFAQRWFERQLFETEIGRNVGLSYFKSRGFREETIRQFGLGYAPGFRPTNKRRIGSTSAGTGSTSGRTDSPHSSNGSGPAGHPGADLTSPGQNDNEDLTTAAIRAGYKAEQLQKLGLSKNGRDFFYDRVMFSIHNLSGKPIAFAGRLLRKEAKAPKYVNSPESEIYHKSRVLYGMYQSRQSIRKLDQVYIVEGYTDVISLHQHGITNVVASSGTSLTAGQAALIKRFTNNATLLYDGDKAGIKAALRGVDILLEQDLNVRVVILPEGEDPDSYIQSVGLEAFQAYLDSRARDFLLFKAGLLLDESGGDIAGKTRVVREISDSLARIDEPLKRAEYIKQFAAMLAIREDLLVKEVNAAVSERRKAATRKSARAESPSPRRTRTPTLPRHGAGNPGPSPQAAGGDDWVPPPDPGYDPGDSSDPGFSHGQPAIDEYRQASSPPTGPTPDEQPPSPAGAAADDLMLGHSRQEQYLARLIMLHGHKPYDESGTTSVGHYLLTNLSDLLKDFDDARYKEVLDELAALHAKGQPSPPPDYWLQHETRRLRQMAIDFSVTPYQYSDGWKKRYGIYLSQKTPEDNQVLDAETFLLIFRKMKIDRKCRDNAAKIRQLAAAGQEDEMMVHLHLQQRLVELRNELAQKLGTVVPPGG